MLRPVVASAAALLLALPSSLHAIAIPGGSIVVSQSGNGSGFPADTGADAGLVIFETTGKNPRTIKISSEDLQFESASGGRLALSADGKSFAVPGYLPPLTGSGPLNLRNDGDARRGFIRFDARNGSPGERTRIKDLGQEAADSVATAGERAWMSGRDNLVSWDGETDVVFNGAGFFVDIVQPKGIRIFGDRLYLAARRQGRTGMIADFNGYPHGDSDQPRVLFDVQNPEDLAVSDDRATVYVSRTEGVVDVYRKEGNSWVRRRTFTGNGAPLRGVAVDFTGKDPVIYAISAGTLFRAVDEGRSGRLRTIAATTGGRTFMGIVVTPGAGAPKVRVTTSKRYRTEKREATIRGTAIDADGVKSVQVRRAGSGGNETVKGTTKWTCKVRLRPGRNIFLVRSQDATGALSAPARVVITRD